MLKLSTMSISNILQKLNSRNTRLIPQLPKLNNQIKFASILITFVFLTLIGRQILAADEVTVDNSAAVKKYQEKQTAINQGNNQESWMSESMMSNAMSINQAIVGDIPNDVLQGKTTTWIPGGMIGFTNQSIAYLYNPPASGVQYIAQSFNNFLGKPAYASAGTDGLKGIQNIWKSFRNAVYILFSVIFIGIGIAIMLRIKISQNAVITIQSAIPQLITSLILVTFSYAIAGLLIDLSYLFSGLVLGILFNSKGGLDSTLFSGWFNNPSFSKLVDGGFPVTYDLLCKTLPAVIITGISAFMSASIVGIISFFSGGFAIGPGIIVGGAAFIIIITLIMIAIIIQTIKFFIGAAKCYINIIFRIIFAPIEIGMGAIPNSKMNFSSWIWSIIANLAVFPCSIIFLVIVNMVLEAISSGNLWNPPMFGLNLLLKAVVGFSAFFIFAKLPSTIPELIFNLKPSPWGKALGEAMKDNMISNYASTAKSTLQAESAKGIATGVGNSMDTAIRRRFGLPPRPQP